MNFRKSWLGNVNFAIGSIFTSVLLVMLISAVLKSNNFCPNIPFVSWIVGFLAVVAVAVIFFVSNYFKKKITTRPKHPVCIIAHIIVDFSAIVTFLYFVYQRGTLILNNTLTVANADIIKDYFEKGKTPYFNISSIYYWIMAKVAGIYGVNEPYFAAFIYIIQTFSVVLLYFAIRFILGRTESLGALIYLTFSKTFLDAPLHESGLIIYFAIVSFLLFFLGLCLNLRSKDSMQSNWNFAYFIILGILFGALTYLNISAIIFFVIPFIAVAIGDKSRKNIAFSINRKAPVLFFTTIAYLIGIVDMAAWDANFRFPECFRLIIGRVLNVAVVPSAGKLIYPFVSASACIAFLLVALCCFLGYLAYGSDVVTPLFASFVLTYLAEVFGIFKDTSFIVAIGAFYGAFAGGGLRALFTFGIVFEEPKEPEPEPEPIPVAPIPSPVVFNVNVNVGEKGTEANTGVPATEEAIKEETAIEEPVKKPFVPIENVLPMPKPHVRKNFDYAFIPSDSQMKYDLDIPESDDFDHE